MVLYLFLLINSLFFSTFATSTLTKQELLEIRYDDIVWGCDNASNVIIEYSSFACPHCGDYHKNILPKLKTEFIDTCKTKYVYRDLPTTFQALRGSLICKCLAIDNNKINKEKYFTYLQVLFNHQLQWVVDNNYQEKIKGLLQFYNVPPQAVDKCLEDKATMMHIVDNALNGMKILEIKQSPYLIINGKIIHFPTYEKIIAELKYP